MMSMKNKRILIIVIVMSLVILTWNKSYSYEMNNNEVEEKEIERKEFAIYLETKQNSSKTESDYSTAETYPNQGYLLNKDKTECYEYGSDKEVTEAVEQSLSSGVIDGSIIVTSQKSIYCNIYFDKDDTQPTVKSLSLTGKDSSNNDLQDYTFSKDVTYTITFDDTDVAQYCVKEGDGVCTDWKQLENNNKSIIGTITISTGDGAKNIYVYLKDKANNVSVTNDNSHKSITLDTTIPTINEFTITGKKTDGSNLNTSYSQQTGVTTKLSYSDDVAYYCITTSDSCLSSDWKSTDTTSSITLENSEGRKTYHSYVKDRANNVSQAKSQSIYLDLNDPTISLSEKEVTAETIVVIVDANDTNGIESVTCRITSPEVITGEYESTAKTCTFGNSTSKLKDGTEYTIEGIAKDKSGRSKTSTSIKVTTIKNELTRDEIIQKYFNGKSPAGLSTTLLGESPESSSTYRDDMYRFTGECNASNNGCNGKVNNFICFGTTTKSQCTLTSDYMYRIIGITRDGRIKVIKNTSVNEGNTKNFSWNSNASKDVCYDGKCDWKNSSLFKRLNGLSNGKTQGYNGNTNIFIDSTTSNVKYIKTTEDTTWYDKIEEHTWLYGDIGDVSGKAPIGVSRTADEMYMVETGQKNVEQGFDESGKQRLPASKWNETVTAKIGLMYLSDYYYSNGHKYNCWLELEKCSNSWLKMDNCSGKNWEYEWTMVRSGVSSSGDLCAWEVTMYGSSPDFRLDGDYVGVRPTFYLTSSVKISGGTGTSTDPFMIEA